MTQTTIRRPGDDFAVLVPFAVGEAAGLLDAEVVEVVAYQDSILLRRAGPLPDLDARSAAEEIIAESRGLVLGSRIRDLLAEGRRD